jgi:hypothetical protein
MTPVSRCRRPCFSACPVALLIASLLLTRASAFQTNAIQHLTGRVVAAADGLPVSQARVLIGSRVVGQTDDAGVFDVQVSAGKAQGRIEKAGYVLQDFDRARADVVIKLRRASTLIVRVVDEAGNPVGGRDVRIADSRGRLLLVTDDRGVDRRTGFEPGLFAAELEALAAPAADDVKGRAEQDRRAGRARAALMNRRNTGIELRPGEQVTVTLTDRFPYGTKPRPSPRSSAIRGHAVGLDGSPVAGARITLVAPLDQQAVLSDASGAYSFDGLAAGKYVMHAQAPGFMLTTYSAARDGVPTVLAVAAGEQRNDVNLQLHRGGSVSGIVADERGQPHEWFGVELLPVNPETHELVSRGATAIAVTDGQGRYRISGIRSGTYVVAARPRAGRTEGVVYYPGVLRPEDATPLRIVEGGAVTGIDLATDDRRGTTVSGTVTDSSGNPLPGGSVRIHEVSLDTVAMLDRYTDIDNDGRFEFRSVPPGRHALAAGSERVRTAVALNSSGLPALVARLPPRESGGTDIVVTDRRPVIADIQMSSKSMVTGRVLLEDPAATVSPAGFELSAAGDGVRTGVRDDWTFELRNISQSSRLALAAAPSGWWLKAVTIDGVNAADVPVKFGAAEDSRHGVVVVLSNTAARLSGQVEDERGTVVPNATVIVFSVDRTRWTERSLHRQSVRADAGGGYVVTVPPGEYWVAAAATSDLGSRALDALTRSAVRITAGAGASVTQNLRPPRR